MERRSPSAVLITNCLVPYPLHIGSIPIFNRPSKRQFLDVSKIATAATVTSRFPTLVVPSDLCLAPVDEQFNPCDKTAVIRGEEQDGFRDFVRTFHSSQRHGAHEALL
ncbi:MAG: hypothetical protein WAK17_06605 [Candidatus Nitrosopolaris sp.]